MLDDPLERLDPRAKHAFLSEIARRGTDLDHFEVRFLDLPLGYVVYTISKHRPPQLRGADSKHPEIEVRISKATFEVVGVASVK